MSRPRATDYPPRPLSCGRGRAEGAGEGALARDSRFCVRNPNLPACYHFVIPTEAEGSRIRFSRSRSIAVVAAVAAEEELNLFRVARTHTDSFRSWRVVVKHTRMPHGGFGPEGVSGMLEVAMFLVTAITLLFEAGIWWMMFDDRRKARETGAPIRHSLKWWLLVGGLSLGPLITLGLTYGIITARIGWTNTIDGTADVPAGASSVTVTVPASLPYTIRKLTPDWEAAGTFVQSKESGHFEIAFNRSAPIGGGALDWEILPRAGSQAVSAVMPTDTPAVIAPTPEPLIDQFVHGTGPFQQAATLIRTTPRSATHPVDVVSTEQSHDIAGAMVGVIQSGAPYGWKLVEHGQPGAFIGAPTEYALDDGITIRAKTDNADATMLWGILRASGLDVKFVSLDSTNSHNDVMLEIGNFPHR